MTLLWHKSDVIYDINVTLFSGYERSDAHHSNLHSEFDVHIGVFSVDAANLSLVSIIVEMNADIVAEASATGCHKPGSPLPTTPVPVCVSR